MMRIKLWQINLDRDTNCVAFEAYSRLEQLQGSPDADKSLYDVVYEGDVDAEDIEEIFHIFNVRHPEGYTARSMSVSDVVEIVESDWVDPGCYYCDTIGFKKIKFKEKEAEE